nr:uncharacterized protein LOC117278398 [Nicotiana tomentosiformis]
MVEQQDRKLQGITKPIQPQYHGTTFGIGYEYTMQEYQDWILLLRTNYYPLEQPIPPLHQTFRQADMISRFEENEILAGMRKLFLDEEGMDCSLIVEEEEEGLTIQTVGEGAILKNWTDVPSRARRVPGRQQEHQEDIVVDNYKQWHEKLPFDLLGYRTRVRTSTRATPYLLVFVTKDVILAEVEIPSLRIIQEAEHSNAKWIQNRDEQLALIDGKRLNAVCHSQLYQNRIERAFKKKVRSRQFTPGKLVLKRIFSHQDEAKGKFSTNWQDLTWLTEY